MEKITSRDNQYLKFARKVRDGREKNHIFIEGKRLVEEAISSGIKFEIIFIVADLIESTFLNIEAASEITYSIPESLLRTLTDTRSPQGIIGIASRPRYELAELSAVLGSRRGQLPVAVLLDEINNPSNLGAILRTAEAAGVTGVITTPRSADAYSAKSIRAAMGSAFRMPVFERVSMNEALQFARENGLAPVIATAYGTVEHTDLDWKLPRLLIFGSEAHGIRSNSIDGPFEAIKISINEPVESLNLAVAAGVILFEAKRQTSIS